MEVRWSIPKNTFTYITFTQLHIFGPRFLFWREKMCKFTQILCKLHKSWSTRGHVDQRSQLHKSQLHKSQNQLKQPLWIHRPLSLHYIFILLGTHLTSTRSSFRPTPDVSWSRAIKKNLGKSFWQTRSRMRREIEMLFAKCVFRCVTDTFLQLSWRVGTRGSFFAICINVFLGTTQNSFWSIICQISLAIGVASISIPWDPAKIAKPFGTILRA